jgi:four helix bundle protein
MIKKFDLEERTAIFSEQIIFFCKLIKPTITTMPIVSQLIRAACSIGANYVEANNACSKKDFKNKIYICKKEAQETKYWLNLLRAALPEQKIKIDKLRQEVHELNLIFQKIITSTEANLQINKIK